LASWTFVASANSPHEELIRLANNKNGVIKLNSQNWDLLTSPKRTWSVVVQLTALDKAYKCQPCKDMDPMFNEVAKAWKSVPKADRDTHFFATLDFNDGQDIFRQLGVASAPIISMYPAAEGPRRLASGKTDAVKYDFNSYGSDPEELAHQISTFTPRPIPYKAPFNWGLILSVGSTLLAVVLAARLVLPVLLNRWTWAALTISTMLVMTSGFMFVRIRGMPYQTAEGTMVSGFQNQVGAEIWHISFLYGSLATSFLALILLVPTQSNRNLQRAGIYIFSGLNFILFSMLLADFRKKNAGYPFKLLF